MVLWEIHSSSPHVPSQMKCRLPTHIHLCFDFETPSCPRRRPSVSPDLTSGYLKKRRSWLPRLSPEWHLAESSAEERKRSPANAKCETCPGEPFRFLRPPTRTGCEPVKPKNEAPKIDLGLGGWAHGCGSATRIAKPYMEL